MTPVCFIRDISNHFLRVVFFTLTGSPRCPLRYSSGKTEFLIIITSKSTSTCWTGFMISKSRLWSNFLHWRTNQLLSFHKFPQKIIASSCSHAYPQGWRAVTVLLSVTFDFAPKAETQSAFKPRTVYKRPPLEEGRPRPTINMVCIICSAPVSGRGTLTGSSLQNLNRSCD